jgi:lysozyme family protein
MPRNRCLPTEPYRTDYYNGFGSNGTVSQVQLWDFSYARHGVDRHDELTRFGYNG